ncbi:MAG: hypothetical protein M3342_06540 [Bacteroidota bacterium]|nr:hypothetical protein [Bacteroidota bacterium]
MKRSLTGEQVIDLNVSDFKRAGIVHSPANKFCIAFSKGQGRKCGYALTTGKMLVRNIIG